MKSGFLFCLAAAASLIPEPLRQCDTLLARPQCFLSSIFVKGTILVTARCSTGDGAGVWPRLKAPLVVCFGVPAVVWPARHTKRPRCKAGAHETSRAGPDGGQGGRRTFTELPICADESNRFCPSLHQRTRRLKRTRSNSC